MLNLLKILFIKYKSYVIAAVVGATVIGALFGYGHMKYDEGYDVAEEKYINQYHNERLIWQQNIVALQRLVDIEKAKVIEALRNKEVEYVEVIQYIKTKPEVITKYIEKEVIIEVPSGFVELHNKAAANASKEELELGPTLPPSTPSGKTLADAAETITLNYYEYNILRARYQALQDIVREFQIRQGELNAD